MPNVARRIGTVLFVTQSLASAGLIANVTVNPIVARQLGGTTALAGLPGTILLIGAASAAYPVGRFMQRAGRRPGLTLGFAVGAVGMLLSGVALVSGSFALFLLSLALIGASRGTLDQSRYAAADAVPPEGRGRAISVVVFASTVGAVGGPALVAPLGQVVNNLGLPTLAGAGFGAAVLFAIGGALIAALLRPDPRDLARTLGHAPEQVATAAPSRSLGELLRQHAAARLALVAMCLGQAVMVLIMTVTSLHMYDHNHTLGDVSLVISAHTLGMFGLSMFTGTIADRFGRPLTIAVGAALTVGGALIAPVSLLTPWLALALFLVGVGWNLCYIAGSTLLADQLLPHERGRVQGASELWVNLASACGSLGSGFILATLGYGWLCLVGACVAGSLGLLALIQLGTPRQPIIGTN